MTTLSLGALCVGMISGNWPVLRGYTPRSFVELALFDVVLIVGMLAYEAVR